MAISLLKRVVDSSNGAGSGVAYGSGASNHVNQESQSFVMLKVTPAYGEGMTSSPDTSSRLNSAAQSRSHDASGIFSGLGFDTSYRSRCMQGYMGFGCEGMEHSKGVATY